MSQMSKLTKYFKSVTVNVVVDGKHGKATTKQCPPDMSWNSTRETVIKAADVSVNITIAKGDEKRESKFQWKDVDGKDVAESLGAADANTERKSRGGIDPALVNGK